MKKLFKFIAGVTAIGAVIAGIVYLTKKLASDDAEDIFSDDFEDDNFDLDDDLGPVEREYVSLNAEAKVKASSSDSTEAAEEAEAKTTTADE